MPIPQAAHYMNCPLHELPITGGLLYVVLTIGLVVYKGEDILSLWDIITFIIVTVPSSLLIKASDHKGCAVIQPGVSWMEEVSRDSSR